MDKQTEIISAINMPALNWVYEHYNGKYEEELSAWPPELGSIKMSGELKKQLDVFNASISDPPYCKEYTVESYLYIVASHWFSLFWTQKFEEAGSEAALKQLLVDIRSSKGFPFGDGVFGPLIIFAYAGALQRLAEENE